MKYLLGFLMFAIFGPNKMQQKEGLPLFEIYVNIMTASSADDLKRAIEIIDKLDNDARNSYAKEIKVAKSNLKSFASLDPKIQNRVILLKCSMFNAADIKSRLDQPGIYEELLKKEAEVSSLIPSMPLFVFFCTHTRMGVGMAYGANLVKEGEIVEKIKLYSDIFGDDSPLLADLYLLLITNQVAHKKFTDAIKLHKKALVLTERFAGIDSRRMVLLKIYLLKCYIEKNDIKKAEDLYNQLNAVDVNSICVGLHYDLYLFYKSMAFICGIKRREKLAISYQDAALGNLIIIRPIDDAAIITEANTLRDMLATVNDFNALRELEKRFNLKKAPKYTGEK